MALNWDGDLPLVAVPVPDWSASGPPTTMGAMTANGSQNGSEPVSGAGPARPVRS
jgi:hypothetical protein